MQPTPTRSPTLNRFTSAPTRVTLPTISWPGTMGKMELPHSSRAWWMSEWQMPQNSMSMATSRGTDGAAVDLERGERALRGQGGVGLGPGHAGTRRAGRPTPCNARWRGASPHGVAPARRPSACSAGSAAARRTARARARPRPAPAPRRPGPRTRPRRCRSGAPRAAPSRWPRAPPGGGRWWRRRSPPALASARRGHRELHRRRVGAQHLHRVPLQLEQVRGDEPDPGAWYSPGAEASTACPRWRGPGRPRSRERASPARARPAPWPGAPPRRWPGGASRPRRPAAAPRRSRAAPPGRPRSSRQASTAAR